MLNRIMSQLNESRDSINKVMSQFKRNQNLIGIDIGSSAIKILELSSGNGHFQVQNYALFPVPSGALVERDIKNTEAVSEAIREAVKLSGCNTKQAAVAIPDSAVISKTIQLDKELKDNEMEEHIIFEADKHIPYAIEEVSLDFQVVGSSQKNPDCVDVLLVASHKNYVDSYVSAVKDSGLSIKVVDVQSHVVERAFPYFAKDLPASIKQTVAVIDIGATMLTLTVLYDGSTIFSRSETFGGQQLTQSIQQKFNLSFADAEKAKLNGDLPPEYIKEVLEPFKELVVLQIRRAMQFYFSNNQQAEVQQIYLTGGTSLLPGLVEQIGNQLGINAALARPFQNMPNNQISEKLIKVEPYFSLAFGLALRRFDEKHGML